MNEFTIVIDQREKLPFDFQSVEPPPATVTATLTTGDYSVLGYESRITVERKSLPDLFGSCGNDRARFEREIVRMADYQFAAVVVEADWLSILRKPPAQSKMNPKTIYASIIAWSTRWGVHWFLSPNRAFAEKTTYRLLERFYRDAQTGLYHCVEEKF